MATACPAVSQRPVPPPLPPQALVLCRLMVGAQAAGTSQRWRAAAVGMTDKRTRHACPQAVLYAPTLSAGAQLDQVEGIRSQNHRCGSEWVKGLTVHLRGLAARRAAGLGTHRVNKHAAEVTAKCLRFHTTAHLVRGPGTSLSCSLTAMRCSTKTTNPTPMDTVPSGRPGPAARARPHTVSSCRWVARARLGKAPSPPSPRGPMQLRRALTPVIEAHHHRSAWDEQHHHMHCMATSRGRSFLCG
jgi:hypothetical protein